MVFSIKNHCILSTILFHHNTFTNTATTRYKYSPRQDWLTIIQCDFKLGLAKADTTLKKQLKKHLYNMLLSLVAASNLNQARRNKTRPTLPKI